MKLIAALSSVVLLAACSGADGSPITGPAASGEPPSVAAGDPELVVGPGANHQYVVQHAKLSVPAAAPRASDPSGINGCTDADFVDRTIAGDTPVLGFELRADMISSALACITIMKSGHVEFVASDGSLPVLVGTTPDGTDPFAVPTGDVAFPNAGDFAFVWGNSEHAQHGVIRVKDYQ